jgi:hypothetical protein
MRRERVQEIFFLAIKINKIADKSLRRDFKKLCKFIIFVIIMLSLFLGCYFCLIAMIYDIYARYRAYILKVWLVPALLQLFLVGFLIFFTFCSFFSFMCFKFYTTRKNHWITKVIFKYVVPKYIIYMYKIRNFTTKYAQKISETKSSEKRKTKIYLPKC